MSETKAETVLTVIGGGLAGCEAAWQAAERGVSVILHEMRPGQTTGAHRTGRLAELVCSNSLGSDLPDRAGGVLKREMERLGSLLLSCAREAAVPAGGALAVDRGRFADIVTSRVERHPRIEVRRGEATSIPSGFAVIATGPLTSPAMAAAIQRLTGVEALFFFDAIAPIVAAESIDRGIVFTKGRQGGEDDYLNCPLEKAEYERFLDALTQAERVPLRAFEAEVKGGVRAGSPRLFEGCLPVEVIAERGKQSLAFGPMRPVGLRDPRTDQRPFAVVQLRQEDLAQSAYNLVGFQTNLKEAEQRRVFRMIPGLGRAEFLRYGQMHRNTFLQSPRFLFSTLQYCERPDLFFAGQLAGVEGYMGNIATGWLAGWNAARMLSGRAPAVPPRDTMIGALCWYIATADVRHFQPMKANFGLLPPLENPPPGKLQRGAAYAARSAASLEAWCRELVDEGE
jgi:methylenetetrahydrofolate--tRNA-(uracil-5-)-methyltransferase